MMVGTMSAAKTPQAPPKLWIEDDLLTLRTGWKQQIVMEVREIPGRRWDAVRKVNTFPLSSVSHVITFAERWGAAIGDDVKALPTGGVEPYHPNSLYKDGDVLKFRFLYNPDTVRKIKSSIAGATWNATEKVWAVSTEFAQEAIDFAQDNGFHIERGLSDDVDAIIAKREEAFALSSALETDAEFEHVSDSLLPYQRAGVAYLSGVGRGLLGDEPGLGKTLQALSVLVENHAFPAVVVCPNTLKFVWRNEIKRFYPHLTSNVLSGRSSEELPYADVTILNYDIVYDRVDDLLALNPMGLVADESHSIKNGKAKHFCPVCNAKVRSNAKNCSMCESKNIAPKREWSVKRAGGVLMLAEAIPNDGIVLMMTGTPITSRPIELIPQLEAINALHHFGGRWKFEQRYCPNGKGAAFMEELNRILRSTCYIRRKKQDVYGELPDLRNAPQVLNISAQEQRAYKKVEADVIDFLATKAREAAALEGTDPSAAYLRKYRQLQNSEQMVRLTVLREAVSKMKFDAITDWLDEFLANSDEKVIVYAEHIDFVEKIAARYGDMAVKIRGGVKMDDREKAVEKFQNDPTCRVFVANMVAASEGLTLTAASNVVFCELAWTPTMHDQCVSRAYGRINDMHGATAWYLLADETIDMDLFQMLEEKRKVVDAVTDGINPTENTNVMMALLERLTERGLSG